MQKIRSDYIEKIPSLDSGDLLSVRPLIYMPEDHGFHSENYDKTASFRESLSFTIPGIELATDDDILFSWSLFITSDKLRQKHPHISVVMSYRNEVSGEICRSVNHIKNDMLSKQSGKDTPNFRFSHQIKDPLSAFMVHYSNRFENWHVNGLSWLSESEGGERNVSYDFDLMMKVQAPGYIPTSNAAYVGGDNGDCDLTDLQPSWGLAHCISAPRSAVEGTININSNKHRIKGIGSFEHRWGNCLDSGEPDSSAWPRLMDDIPVSDQNIIFSHPDAVRAA